MPRARSTDPGLARRPLTGYDHVDERTSPGGTAGTYLPRRPVADVRPHVDALRAAGMAVTVIVERSGVSRHTIQGITSGLVKHVMGATAAALLAVQPEQVRRRGSVPGGGTARRIQALAAVGWSFAEMGR